MNKLSSPKSGEKGFTLVELAIVMIIIGLLIGGILKGQELIANARLASAVTRVKAIDAAINTFRDSYAGLPGDLIGSATRLPGCLATTRCATDGNGNSQIGVGPGAVQAAASENIVAWAQLSATDLLGGVQNTPVATNIGTGVTNPDPSIPGQVTVGYAANLAGLDAETTTVVPRAGHYLAIYNAAPAAAAANTVVATNATTSLTPNQASRLDIKLDDSLPNTGSVLAMGAIGAAGTGCAAGTTDTAANNVYQSGGNAAVCGVYIRIQQ